MHEWLPWTCRTLSRDAKDWAIKRTFDIKFSLATTLVQAQYFSSCPTDSQTLLPVWESAHEEQLTYYEVELYNFGIEKGCTRSYLTTV